VLAQPASGLLVCSSVLRQPSLPLAGKGAQNYKHEVRNLQARVIGHTSTVTTSSYEWSEKVCKSSWCPDLSLPGHSVGYGTPRHGAQHRNKRIRLSLRVSSVGNGQHLVKYLDSEAQVLPAQESP
jgi:hypothetical protein